MLRAVLVGALATLGGICDARTADLERQHSGAEVVGVSKATCDASNIQIPSIKGLDIVSIEASAVQDDSAPRDWMVNQNYFSDDPATGLDYCNITSTHQYPGYHERPIKTVTLLPLRNWNGRFMATGGSCFSVGAIAAFMKPRLSEGFAVSSTAGGLSKHTMADSDTEPISADEWALRSEGNVDLEALSLFGYRSIADLAEIGPAVVESFYGKKPTYKYWNGCSTGGRQGLMLAQRFPEAFDGILATCPAINWPRFLSADLYPQLVMREAGVFPPPCEFVAIRDAAIEACDGLDGVVDGYVADPEQCKFDLSTLVEKQIECPDLSNGTATISKATAAAAEAAWYGYHTADGEWRYYGVGPTANLTTPAGLTDTSCDQAGVCTPEPFSIATSWIRNFLMREPNADPLNLTLEEFDHLWQLSIQEWSSFLSTDDPDLSAFKRAGGKMIVWHGLDDSQIPAAGTEEYYRRAMEQDSDVQDYFRFFQIPGIGHCYGGEGPFPGNGMQALMNWVEKGVVPETLYGRTQSGLERPLCAYPKKVRYIEGRPSDSIDAFECV